MTPLMNKQPPFEFDTYSEDETVARREAALKRMLATPHKEYKTLPKKRARPAKGTFDSN